jgi:riboflavin biosynthesis pyrimidine reductase
VKDLTDQIDELHHEIATIVTSLSTALTQNAKLDEINVGLAVSIDGSIGIASAGTELGIKLTYKTDIRGEAHRYRRGCTAASLSGETLRLGSNN